MTIVDLEKEQKELEAEKLQLIKRIAQIDDRLIEIKKLQARQDTGEH